MFTIRKILNGNNLDEDFPSIIPGEITKFKYAKITSCVERNFSKYKNYNVVKAPWPLPLNPPLILGFFTMGAQVGT